MVGVNEAARRLSLVLADKGLLLHGTTIATNAVLERKLARGMLLTTAGFEDVLEITCHFRRDVYGLTPDPFPVLVPRHRRFGVTERMRANGSVETALDEVALPVLLARIDAAQAEAVAVGLLHAYANPAHEQALKSWLARSRLLRAEAANLPALTALVAKLRAEADARLAADGVAVAAREIHVAADMRYHDQGFEPLVPWGDIAMPDAAALTALVQRFHAMHKQRFSYDSQTEAVEIVTLRVTAIGGLPKQPSRCPPRGRH